MSAAQSIDVTERFVSSSFCSEKFPSSKAMGDHLLTCGNKTDQCPNCGKFVRRAMFAYHYENGCANLDEIDNNTRSNSERSNASSTFQSDNPVRITTEFHENNRQRANVITSDFISDSLSHNAHVPSPNSAIRTTTVCPHCDCECERADLSKHAAACLFNPKNIKEKQQTRVNDTSIREPDRLRHDDQITENALIPCDYCNHSIAWRDYQQHFTKCRKEQYEQMQRQRDNYNSNSIRWIRCRYCDEEHGENCIAAHERLCYKYPQLSTNTQYAPIYRQLPRPLPSYPYGSFYYYY